MQQPEPISYSDCCQTYHQGNAAPNVEALMRSRFSGFVLGLTDYVKQTWHPDTCPNDLQLQPDSQWKKLDIITTTENTVHFRAYLQNEDKQFECLEEHSRFEQVDGKWVYVDGNVSMNTVQLQRNDMCLCGSGKKHKKCCNQ